MCALHTGLHLASLTKTETVCMPCTNKTTANFCNFSSPYSRHPWANVPHRQEGTSANIIITQTIIRLYPYSHCSDITKKMPKCQNYPLTCIVMKISAISLSALLGPPTPKLPRFVPAVCYTLSQNLMPNVPPYVDICWTIQTKSKTKKNSKLNITSSATVYGEQVVAVEHAVILDQQQPLTCCSLLTDG